MAGGTSYVNSSRVLQVENISTLSMRIKTTTNFHDQLIKSMVDLGPPT